MNASLTLNAADSPRSLALLIALLATSISLAHCGDDDDNAVTCGAGTVLSNGTCLPDSNGGSAGANNAGTAGNSASGGSGGSAQAGAAGGGKGGSGGQSGGGGTGAVSMLDDDPCPEPASALVAQCATSHGLCPGVDASDCWTKCAYHRSVGEAIRVPNPPFEIAFRVGIDVDSALCDPCSCAADCGLNVRNNFSFYFDPGETFYYLRVEVDAPWSFSTTSGEECGEWWNCHEFQVTSSAFIYLHSDEAPAPVRNVWVRTIAESELGGCQ